MHSQNYACTLPPSLLSDTCKHVLVLVPNDLQGSKDVSRIKSLVNSMLRRVGSSESNEEAQHDVYKVHMAVLTCNIGKRLSVAQGNLMCRTAWKALSMQGGALKVFQRTEEVQCTASSRS